MNQYSDKLAAELDYWVNRDLLASKRERVEWLESEATYIKGMIHRATKVPLRTHIKTLQIGAGPWDVIDHWHDGERHAIDPLAKEYKEKFDEFQDKSVRYIAGRGEELPYEDDYFDVVIIRNCLDHVDDPWQTLREVFRVLKPTGALYVWMYLFSWRGSLAYRLINALTRRFKKEPYAFSFGQIKKCLTTTGFIPCLPAVEERPIVFHKPKSISDWLRQTLKKALDFKYDRGFTCVALPRKGVYEEWAILASSTHSCEPLSQQS